MRSAEHAALDGDAELAHPQIEQLLVGPVGPLLRRQAPVPSASYPASVSGSGSRVYMHAPPAAGLGQRSPCGIPLSLSLACQSLGASRCWCPRSIPMTVWSMRMCTLAVLLSLTAIPGLPPRRRQAASASRPARLRSPQKTGAEARAEARRSPAEGRRDGRRLRLANRREADQRAGDDDGHRASRRSRARRRRTSPS